MCPPRVLNIPLAHGFHAPVHDGAIEGDVPEVLAAIALHFLDRLGFLKRNFLVEYILHVECFVKPPPIATSMAADRELLRSESLRLVGC